MNSGVALAPAESPRSGRPQALVEPASKAVAALHPPGLDRDPVPLDGQRHLHVTNRRLGQQGNAPGYPLPLHGPVGFPRPAQARRRGINPSSY